MKSVSAIGGAIGGERPGVGATSEPKHGQPRSTEGLARQHYRQHFRFAGHRLTRRGRVGRIRPGRGQGTTNLGTACHSFMVSACQVFRRERLLSKPAPVTEAPSAGTAIETNRTGQGSAVTITSGTIDIEKTKLPDGSDVLRGELASLIAYYAERIAAAQLCCPPPMAKGLVQRLVDERTVAVRNLMERWSAEHHAEKPERPGRPSSLSPNSSPQKPGD